MYLTVFVRAAVIIQSCLFTLNYYLIYSIKSCWMLEYMLLDWCRSCTILKLLLLEYLQQFKVTDCFKWGML